MIIRHLLAFRRHYGERGQPFRQLKAVIDWTELITNHNLVYPEKPCDHSRNLKVIDCFTFFNEIDLLKCRLHELYSSVDWFVICEGDSTFTGNPKRSVLRSVINELDFDCRSKIVSVVARLPETNNPWVREFCQRNSIMDGLIQLDLDPSDIVLISDVDEIPSRKTIQAIKSEFPPMFKSAFSLEMRLYYYSLEWTSSRFWYHAKALTYAALVDMGGAQVVRDFKSPFVITNAGWHLSYFGGVEAIRLKLESFSEQQDNTDRNRDQSYLVDCANQGILHFNNEKLLKRTSDMSVPSYFIRGQS